MNAPKVADTPIDPRKLNVARPTNTLTRLLAWLLVFVLVSFVGVCVWFMVREHQLREQVAEAWALSGGGFLRGGGSVLFGDPPDIERVVDPLPALHEQARDLEAFQHALDEGGMATGSPTVSGWESEYLKRQFHRCLLDLPRDSVSLDESLARFPASSFLLATFGSWATPSNDARSATSADGRLVAFGIRNKVQLCDLNEGRSRHVLRVERSHAELLAFSGDGKRLLVASRTTKPVQGEGMPEEVTGFFEVWDTQTGRRLFTFWAHDGAILKVALTHDGMRAVSVGTDGRVKVWDLAPPERILVGDGVRPLGLAFEPDANTITALGEDGKVRRWHAWSGKRLPDVTLANFDAKMSGTILHADGGLVAAIGADRRAQVWDAGTGKMRWTLDVPGKGSKALLAFSPDGKFLASARGRELCVWRIEDGGFCRGQTCSETITSLAFLGDGWLAWSDANRMLWAWNPKTNGGRSWWPDGGAFPARQLIPRVQDVNRRPLAIGEQAIQAFECAADKTQLAYVRRAPDPIRHAILSHDGKRIVAVCESGRLVVWDAKTGVQLAVFRTDAAASRLAFSNDGQCLAVASTDGTIRLLDSATPADPVAIQTHEQPVTSIARPGTGALVIGHKGGAWGEWDGTNGRTLARYRPVDGDILALRASNNEASVVYRTPRGQTRSHCTDGENDLLLNEPGLVALSPCGRGVACARGDGRAIRFHDLTENKSSRWHDTPGTGKLSRLASLFDSERLALARGEVVWIGKRNSDDWNKSRFDADITAMQFTLPQIDEKKESRAVEELAVGTSDGRVWLCEIDEKTLASVAFRPALPAPVCLIRVGPAREYLAAGDEAGNVHVWELTHRRLVRTYRHVGPIGVLNLSGSKLAIGCTDGTTWLHDVTRR